MDFPRQSNCFNCYVFFSTGVSVEEGGNIWGKNVCEVPDLLRDSSQL